MLVVVIWSALPVAATADSRTVILIVPVSRDVPGPARVVTAVAGLTDLACVSTSVCQALTSLDDAQVGLTAIAPPPVFGCTGSVAGSRAGTLRLRTGATCLSRLTLKGTVFVGRGASLDVDQAKITGSIIAAESSRIRICGATIGGSVKVAAAVGVVQIGDPDRDGCTVNRSPGRSRSSTTPTGLTPSATVSGAA